MKNILLSVAALGIIAGCTTTETSVRAYNGNTVEVELLGETFAFGSAENKQAQLDAAQKQATTVCGKAATFLSRRLDSQPQNGMYFVPDRHIALYKCG